MIDVGHELNGMVITTEDVWVGSTTGLSRIDPETNEAAPKLDVPNIAGFFAIGFGSAWVSDFDQSLVRRVDLESGRILAEIATGANPEGVALTDDAVWVANHRDGTITRIDPATNLAAATIKVGQAGPGGPQHIVASAEAVWVGMPNARAVVRVDPSTNAVTDVITTTLTPCGAMLLGDDQVWVTTCENSVIAIDITTKTENGAVFLYGQGGGLFEHEGRVWVSVLGATQRDPGHLRAIDTDTLEHVDAIELPPSSYEAGFAFGTGWSAANREGVVRRYDPASLR